MLMKNMKEQREKKYRDDINNGNRVNKAFEKVNQFDGSNSDQCLPWMEEIFAMAHNHRRNAREELLYNNGGSYRKHCIPYPLKLQKRKFVMFY